MDFKVLPFTITFEYKGYQVKCNVADGVAEYSCDILDKTYPTQRGVHGAITRKIKAMNTTN